VVTVCFRATRGGQVSAAAVARHREKKRPVLANTGNPGRAVAIVEPDDTDTDHDEFDAPKNARALPQEARIRGFLYRAQEHQRRRFHEGHKSKTGNTFYRSS
jgi:hypothetical protein